MSSDIATILRPKSIAVIGASEDQTKFGGRLYRLLLKHNFAGTVYPINPNRPQLFGLKTYPNLAATPTPADMVVMAVPRHLVPGFITEAASIGVRAAIVITAKFSDEGPEGAALEAEITRIARAELVARGLPFTDSLEDAVRAIAGWCRYTAWAPPIPAIRPADLPQVALPAAAGPVTPADLAALLTADHLPIAPQAICADAQEAALAAARIGYPVALKALGADLVHKTEAGGVILNLTTEAALKTAIADLQDRLGTSLQALLIQRINRDPQFGPMVVLGAGGILVELLHDVVMAPAPLSPAAAAALLHRLRVAAILRGIRGRPPLDIAAVVTTIVNLSWLAHDHRERLAELDINPLIVSPIGCTIVDARALLLEQPK